MASAASKPRIFIGLIDIASYYSGLKQGFDELGVEAVFVPLAKNKFTREVTGNPRCWVLSLVNWVLRIGCAGFSNRLTAAAYHRGIFPLTKVVLLVWAAFRFDVFIFGFASTFFNYRELPLLRRLGKKIIFVFNGSDSRPPYISGNYIHPEFRRTIEECLAATRHTKASVLAIERNADFCVNHPPQAHFHERKFVNHCFVGHPCKLWVAPAEEGVSAPSLGLRIVHAPSNPGPKGTAIIRELIGRLQREGHPIHYIELINRPNHEVLQELSRCDLVIDELYSDIPLAGLGTEAAFFGKPAVVGGYAQTELGAFARQAGLPMRLYVRPEQVEAVVRRLLADEAFRKETGAAAQAFVTENWTPAQVAGRFLQLIAGKVPPEWWHDPKGINYLLGWGVSETEAREYLAQYVKVGGIQALQLADKPALEASFLRLAGCGA